jgi:parvulin-like peptidyl-prolyl isomerase
MMQAFRSSAKIIAIVFAVLMVLFLIQLSGIGGGGGTVSSTSVGRVDGKSIDTRDYQQVVQNRIQAVQQQSPQTLTLDDIEQIRDEVWEEFVSNTVLSAEYGRRKITVSAGEVAEVLRNVPPPELQEQPDFQTDGQFDMSKYQRWLTSSVGMQYVPLLEAQYRSELMRSKLLRVVTADVYLSDAALWERYRDANDAVTIGLTAVIPRRVIPDSVIEVTDDEIAAYYRSHTEDLTRPETAYLSLVLLSRTPNASDSTAALDRATQIRQEILDGAPFGELARRESADTVSGNSGGDLGSWTRGSFAPAFDSAAFSMRLNTLSTPVLTDFGYHIIEMTARRADTAEGRHILVPIELVGEHRDLVDTQADSMEELGAERLDPAALDTVSSALGLQIYQANPVQRGTRVQVGNLVVPDAGVWAFRAQEGEVSSIIEDSRNFYLFRLDSLLPEGVPPLSDPTVRASVVEEVRAIKKWDAARVLGQEYLDRLDRGEDMAQTAEAMGFAHQEVGPFIRTRPPLPNPVLVGAAFGIPPGQQSRLLDTKEGLYVIEVHAREPADSAEFVKILDEYRTQEIRMARQDRVRHYLTALRASADVVDRRDDLYRTAAQLEAEADRQAQAQGALGF